MKQVTVEFLSINSLRMLTCWSLRFFKLRKEHPFKIKANRLYCVHFYNWPHVGRTGMVEGPDVTGPRAGNDQVCSTSMSADLRLHAHIWFHTETLGSTELKGDPNYQNIDGHVTTNWPADACFSLGNRSKEYHWSITLSDKGHVQLNFLAWHAGPVGGVATISLPTHRRAATFCLLLYWTHLDTGLFCFGWCIFPGMNTEWRWFPQWVSPPPSADPQSSGNKLQPNWSQCCSFNPHSPC